MSSNPKAPEVIEWQAGQDDGEEGGDELSRTSAPSVVTMVSHLAQSRSPDRTPRSPSGLGFLAKYRKAPGPGRPTPEPTCESLMTIRIRRLEQILRQFGPKLTVSQDTRQHLAFCSLLTDIFLRAQELVTVKNQLKAGVLIVGRELARIDEQVQLLDLESQKVQ